MNLHNFKLKLSINNFFPHFFYRQANFVNDLGFSKQRNNNCILPMRYELGTTTTTTTATNNGTINV